MGMRKIAFWAGLFSLVVGVLTYDREVATAPVPVVTGIIVIILALFNLIPEFNTCGFCGKKVPKKADRCRYCGADLHDKKNSTKGDPS